MCTSSAPSRFAATAASIAVLPAPMTTTLPRIAVVAPSLIVRDELQRIDHPGVSSPLHRQPCIAPRPTPRKITSYSCSNAASAASSPISRQTELHPEPCDHLDLAQAVRRAQLVLRHAIGIQPARQRTLAQRRSPEIPAASAPPRSQRCRASADAGDPPFFSAAAPLRHLPPPAWKLSIAYRCRRPISMGCWL